MSSCVTLHEAEEMCDAQSAFRSWKQAVRELEINDDMHCFRVKREKELYLEWLQYDKQLRIDAEWHIKRSAA